MFQSLFAKTLPSIDRPINSRSNFCFRAYHFLGPTSSQMDHPQFKSKNEQMTQWYCDIVIIRFGCGWFVVVLVLLCWGRDKQPLLGGKYPQPRNVDPSRATTKPKTTVVRLKLRTGLPIDDAACPCSCAGWIGDPQPI